jgi:hypothetical protein
MSPGAQLGPAAVAEALAVGFGLALDFVALGVTGGAVVGGISAGVVSEGSAAGLPYAADGSVSPAWSAAMDEPSAAGVPPDGPLPVNCHASTASTVRLPPRMKNRRRQ